jgi:ketopantoate reductase
MTMLDNSSRLKIYVAGAGAVGTALAGRQYGVPDVSILAAARVH